MDWKDLFGSDDDSDSCIDNGITTFEDIPGLCLIRKALEHEAQMSMTHEIIQRGYFTGDNNQAMCFGELPAYLSQISNLVLHTYPSLFDTQVLNREPLFDQAILNLFEDGILILSLLSSCVMTMKRASDNVTKRILLCPGDILSLSRDARFLWEHGIEEQLSDQIDDQTIERGTRISVTLRKLKNPGTIETMATSSNRY
ncbi:hypothetical protein INT47_004239 [Mucor saturninus]|uniref:Alpha-ketoglutarate-dependent dioxygenase AlkB-like domain-containing protein n=1 Tax=Mucor saturninus TaxID=64648 RepID=A0A8H7RAC7_9FUNG|nr:hypothetical protein INT47_004239 [Mucor saturninus]